MPNVSKSIGGKLREEILGTVAHDLLSVPPLILRMLRRKLIKTTLAGVEADINLPHFEIMRVLREGGTLHVAEIAEKLQIAKAQMTHLIDRLVELGLVARQLCDTDRRTLNIVSFALPTLQGQGRAPLLQPSTTGLGSFVFAFP